MKWAEPSAERAYYIASNVRKQDEMEVWLSHHVPGAQAVLESWAGSDICRCIESSSGIPLALTGVCGDRIWLLGTDGLTATKERRLQLCREGRDWVKHCLEFVGQPIGNHVHSKNRQSVRWLRWLGFEVGTPEPFGPSAELFNPFWMEVK
jgi:hypothetical protein